MALSQALSAQVSRTPSSHIEPRTEIERIQSSAQDRAGAGETVPFFLSITREDILGPSATETYVPPGLTRVTHWDPRGSKPSTQSKTPARSQGAQQLPHPLQLIVKPSGHQKCH